MMKNKKIILILLLTAITSLTFNCYSQIDQYDISGSWIATEGELVVSFIPNRQTEIKEIDISNLRFIFDKKSVKINRAFGKWYSVDSIYNYAFMDTIQRNHRHWNKIRIKSYDNNNIVLEMKFLGTKRTDRIMWYDVYLKREY